MEGAKEAAESRKYNVALWMFATMQGEFRWLNTGCYGNLTYSSFNKNMLKPLKELM
jgi:hypothetical protein